MMIVSFQSNFIFFTRPKNEIAQVIMYIILIMANTDGNWRKPQCFPIASDLHVQPPIMTAAFVRPEGIDHSHYARLKIQPFEYAYGNHLDFFQGTVIKYVSRWKHKNGVEDLNKAKDTLQQYIQFISNDPQKKKKDRAMANIKHPLQMYFPDCSIHLSICQHLLACSPGTYAIENQLDPHQQAIVTQVTTWTQNRDLECLHKALRTLDTYIAYHVSQ